MSSQQLYVYTHLLNVLFFLPLLDCTYVRAWVTVKHYYSLAVDSAEKDALSSILDGC